MSLPESSLIIIAWDNFELTRLFVTQCLQKTDGDLEVIVVDNGSTDPTPAWLQDIAAHERRLSFIRNETNLGYPRALNQGLMRAQGEYLVCLNNDHVVLCGDWLQKLIAPLRDNHRLLVGTRLVRHNRQVEVDGWVPDYLEGCCLAFRRGFLGEVGYFDEAYSPAFVEDVDLSWRAVAHGYELRPVGVGLWHLYGQTTYLTHRAETKFWEVTPRNVARFRAKVRAGDDRPVFPEALAT